MVLVVVVIVTKVTKKTRKIKIQDVSHLHQIKILKPFLFKILLKSLGELDFSVN